MKADKSRKATLPGKRINGAQRRLLAESASLLGLAMLAPLFLKIMGQPVSAGAVIAGPVLGAALLVVAVWLLAGSEPENCTVVLGEQDDSERD